MNGAELQDWLWQRTWTRWIVGEHRTDPAAPVLSSIDHIQRQNTLFSSDVYPPITPSSCTEDSNQPLLHKIPAHPDRSHNSLYFATLSMTFSVQPTNVSAGPRHGYKICKLDGTPCDKIFLDPKWKYVPNQQHEFLALSEAKSRQIARIELPAREGAEWDAYHVTMIFCPEADGSAERIGLGIVLRESMREEFGAVWKEVWLR